MKVQEGQRGCCVTKTTQLTHCRQYLCCPLDPNSIHQMAVAMRAAVAARVSARPAVSCRPAVALPASRIPQRRVVVRAETDAGVDSEKIMKDLQERWDKLDNKPQVLLYVGGGVFALWLTSTVIGAINNIPLVPKLLELVGLGYSAWFTYRYLLFKSSREELIKDVEELKSKITGN